MNDRGWFAMPRGWMKNPAFEPSPFSEREAWAWLSENACFAPLTVTLKNGFAFRLERGELLTSLRRLAGEWGWNSDKRVRRFLRKLSSHGLIEIDRTRSGTHGQTHIRLCNIDKIHGTGRGGGRSVDAGGSGDATKKPQKRTRRRTQAGTHENTGIMRGTNDGGRSGGRTGGRAPDADRTQTGRINNNDKNENKRRAGAARPAEEVSGLPGEDWSPDLPETDFGTAEGDQTDPDTDLDESRYAWEGLVVHLTEDHYRQLYEDFCGRVQSCYRKRETFEKSLADADAWFAGESKEERRRWWFRLRKWIDRDIDKKYRPLKLHEIAG